MRSFIGSFARVWALVSRLPLPAALSPREWALPDGRDLCVFPLCGALLGLIAAIPACAAALLLPARASAWICTALYAAIGWSLHLDGLGDLCDGLGSGRRGEAMLSVMKDPRAGAFAVCGIVCALALRSELLASVPAIAWPACCALCCGTSRIAANAAACAGSYPWSVGMSAAIVNGTGGRELLLAVLLTSPLSVLSPLCWLASVLASASAGLAVSQACERTLGGTNGDALGAASVLGELASLCAFAAAGSI